MSHYGERKRSRFDQKPEDVAPPAAKRMVPPPPPPNISGHVPPPSMRAAPPPPPPLMPVLPASAIAPPPLGGVRPPPPPPSHFARPPPPPMGIVPPKSRPDRSDSESPSPPPAPFPKLSSPILLKKPGLPSNKSIAIKLGGAKLPVAAPKPKSQKVAAIFNADDSDEEDEMPPEAKMRMRNVGRDTITSAGPNSFGKTRQGFCDTKKLVERKLMELDSDQ